MTQITPWFIFTLFTITQHSTHCCCVCNFLQPPPCQSPTTSTPLSVNPPPLPPPPSPPRSSSSSLSSLSPSLPLLSSFNGVVVSPIQRPFCHLMALITSLAWILLLFHLLLILLILLIVLTLVVLLLLLFLITIIGNLILVTHLLQRFVFFCFFELIWIVGCACFLLFCLIVIFKQKGWLYDDDLYHFLCFVCFFCDLCFVSFWVWWSVWVWFLVNFASAGVSEVIWSVFVNLADVEICCWLVWVRFRWFQLWTCKEKTRRCCCKESGSDGE